GESMRPRLCLLFAYVSAFHFCTSVSALEGKKVNTRPHQSEAGTVTAGQAARLLMLTPRRLRQLAEVGHIPAAVKGRYPLASVVRGYLQFLRARVERISSDNPGANLATAKEKEIRLRTRQREAQLVDTIDVEAFHKFSSSLYR